MDELHTIRNDSTRIASLEKRLSKQGAEEKKSLKKQLETSEWKLQNATWRIDDMKRYMEVQGAEINGLKRKHEKMAAAREKDAHVVKAAKLALEGMNGLKAAVDGV